MAGTDVKAMMNRGREFAGRLTPIQKIALGAAVVTLIAGAFVLTRTGSGPSMSPLYTDLESTDASALVDELNSRGVPYELTDAGHTVLVPKDQVYDLRIAMAGAGLPSSNQGYALLDNQGITTSEFRQRIDYQRALEGELANTLKAMDGVQAATVHLALPEESVFVDEPMDPTASVMISTKSSGSVSDDQVQAIVHLVSSAVKNMQPDDVTVIDANGTVLSAPGVSGGASGSNARTKEQTAYEQKVSAAIMAMLARTTGADKVAVTVTADLDLDERQSTSENYGAIGDDTSGGEVVSEKTNVEIYGPDAANGTTGILGPDGATITSTVPTSVSDGGYASADSDRAYAIDRVVEQVTDAPGEVNKLGVAVLLDEATVSEAQATQIEELVKTAAGIDPARGDIVTVTRLPFDTSAETEASEAAKQDAAAAAKTRMMELIRTLAVVFVIIIALVLAYRSTRKARKITATPIDIGEITASSGSGKSSGSLTPELVSSPGSGSVGAGDATPRAVGAGASHPNGLLLAMDKIDSPMAEIAEIAETRPEEVANVLRAWLNESKVGRR